MMKIQHSSHGPEWNVMQGPASDEPNATFQGSLLGFMNDGSRLRVLSTLFYDRLYQIDEGKEGKKAQVAPPNDWVAQEVNSLIIAREELTLKKNDSL